MRQLPLDVDGVYTVTLRRKYDGVYEATIPDAGRTSFLTAGKTQEEIMDRCKVLLSPAFIEFKYPDEAPFSRGYVVNTQKSQYQEL